jgi:pyrroline-5-carboxylate reductase
MGLALARGWIAGGLAPADLTLVDPSPQASAVSFARETGATLVSEAGGVPPRVLVLAVKPQIVAQVLPVLQSLLGPETVVVSIAAGIPLGALSEGLNSERVVRAMPNTPAQVGKGMTGAVAAPGITDADRAVADALLRAIGDVIWFEREADLDAVTALSGSGPAYVFHMVEAMAAAGVHQGLTPDDAMRLARRTVIGAAALMDADPTEAGALRQNVTSPNGTTAAALDILMAPDGLTSLLDRAISRARERSEELGRG